MPLPPLLLLLLPPRLRLLLLLLLLLLVAAGIPQAQRWGNPARAARAGQGAEAGP